MSFLIISQKIRILDIPAEAGRIIAEMPGIFNPHRKISGYYDGYTALSILMGLHLVPNTSFLQELLIRNPFRTELREDLETVLTRIWESEMTVACAFVCEPLVFTIFWWAKFSHVEESVSTFFPLGQVKENPGFSSAPAFQNSCRINFFYIF